LPGAEHDQNRSPRANIAKSLVLHDLPEPRTADPGHQGPSTFISRDQYSTQAQKTRFKKEYKYITKTQARRLVFLVTKELLMIIDFEDNQIANV